MKENPLIIITDTHHRVRVPLDQVRLCCSDNPPKLHGLTQLEFIACPRYVSKDVSADGSAHVSTQGLGLVEAQLDMCLQAHCSGEEREQLAGS